MSEKRHSTIFLTDEGRRIETAKKEIAAGHSQTIREKFAVLGALAAEARALGILPGDPLAGLDTVKRIARVINSVR